MTDDLVQRLRRTYLKEYAPTGSMVGDISNRLRPFPILATEVLFNPDGPEAADRIEALQADNAKLREALAPFARHIGKVDALVTLKIGDATWTGTLTGQDFATAYHLVNLANPKYREWLALQETGQ